MGEVRAELADKSLPDSNLEWTHRLRRAAIRVQSARNPRFTRRIHCDRQREKTKWSAQVSQTLDRMCRGIQLQDQRIALRRGKRRPNKENRATRACLRLECARRGGLRQ